MLDTNSQPQTLTLAADAHRLIPVIPKAGAAREAFMTSLADHVSAWLPDIEVNSAFEATVDRVFGSLWIDTETRTVATHVVAHD